MPIVDDIGMMKQLFYSEIDDANHHSVETEDEHGSYRNKGDEAASDWIERFCQVDKGKYWDSIY